MDRGELGEKGRTTGTRTETKGNDFMLPLCKAVPQKEAKG
jgi:hypothetical protein